MQHNPGATLVYAIVTFFVVYPIIMVPYFGDSFEVVTGNYLYVPLFSLFITPMVVIPLIWVKKVLFTHVEREGTALLTIFSIVWGAAIVNACITLFLIILFFNVK